MGTFNIVTSENAVVVFPGAVLPHSLQNLNGTQDFSMSFNYLCSQKSWFIIEYFNFIFTENENYFKILST